MVIVVGIALSDLLHVLIHHVDRKPGLQALQYLMERKSETNEDHIKVSKIYVHQCIARAYTQTKPVDKRR